MAWSQKCHFDTRPAALTCRSAAVIITRTPLRGDRKMLLCDLFFISVGNPLFASWRGRTPSFIWSEQKASSYDSFMKKLIEGTRLQTRGIGWITLPGVLFETDNKGMLHKTTLWDWAIIFFFLFAESVFFPVTSLLWRRKIASVFVLVLHNVNQSEQVDLPFLVDNIRKMHCLCETCTQSSVCGLEESNQTTPSSSFCREATCWHSSEGTTWHVGCLLFSE